MKSLQLVLSNTELSKDRVLCVIQGLYGFIMNNRTSLPVGPQLCCSLSPLGQSWVRLGHLFIDRSRFLYHNRIIQSDLSCGVKFSLLVKSYLVLLVLVRHQYTNYISRFGNKPCLCSNI